MRRLGFSRQKAHYTRLLAEAIHGTIRSPQTP
jgi:hypothetical protein